jgi:hypothetical protein
VFVEGFLGPSGEALNVVLVVVCVPIPGTVLMTFHFNWLVYIFKSPVFASNHNCPIVGLFGAVLLKPCSNKCNMFSFKNSPQLTTRLPVNCKDVV